MRLDPPGFTGPSTPCYRANATLDRSYSSSTLPSSSDSPLDFLSRRIPTLRSSFFRLRRSVDTLPPSRAPLARRADTLEHRHDIAGAATLGAYRRFVSWVQRSSLQREKRFKIRNATAFRVSCCLFCRSGVRARIRPLANISGKSWRVLRFRPCPNRCDGYANHGSSSIDVSIGRSKDNDDDDDDDDDEEDDRFDNIVGNIVSVDERSSLLLRVSRSRSFQNAASKKPRTRWKRKDHRDRTIFQESLDFSRNSSANATNVPQVDAFAYTAYNDENENEVEDEDADEDEDEDEDEDADEDEDEDEREKENENENENESENENEKKKEVENEKESYRDNGNSRTPCTIENIRDGLGRCPDDETKLCNQLYEHRDKVEANCICDKGQAFEKYLGCRYRDSLRRDTREKLRVERCENHYYTARFQEPITNESCEYERELSTPGPTKVPNSCGRKYRLLFILYLLSWPLVCSTNPSGLFPSSFTYYNPSLGPAENLSHHNSTQFSSLLSSSIVHQLQQKQQKQQQNEHYQQVEENYDTREHLVRDAEYNSAMERGEQGREQRETVPELETVHPYNEYSWEVNQINPWLSACDLAGPAPADLQGSCGPPEVPKNCPIPCALNTKEKGKDAEFHAVMERIEQAERTERTNYRASRAGEDATDGKVKADREISGGVRMAPEQCLFYLEESHKEDICRDDFGRTSPRSFLTPRKNRYWFMSGLRLRHCCEHAVVNALAPGKGGQLEDVLNGGQKCVDALDKLLLVDALAARLHCEFEEVLARYDCAQPYSVIFNCTHCKEAYRKWVCSSLVPYFAHGGPQDLATLDSWVGSRLRPCRSICQSVEQRCPYLLPGDRAPAYPTQYAGEPTFLCRDPNIPETGEQAARALHSSDEDECCFRTCSEETRGSGICANCTGREARKRGRIHDPPTAPHCEINPIQPASTGGDYRESGSTDSSLEEGERYDSTTDSMAASMTNTIQQQGASLCGSGGVGSMTSVSSSDGSSASIHPQLFWLCTILSSAMGNARTIPVLWISKIFLWSIGSVASLASHGGNSGVAGESVGGGAGGSGSNGIIQLDDFVGWLRRRFGSVTYVRVHCGAKWLIEKWIAFERRFRSWWCYCWYWWWWWWRWRRRWANGLVRWKFQPRRFQLGNGRFHRRFIATRHPTSIGFTSTATVVSLAKDEFAVDSRGIFCESLHGHSSARTKRSTRRFFVDCGFSVKCPRRRWSWWLWWLYRWWRWRRARYGGQICGRTLLRRRNCLAECLHGPVRRRRERRRRRRRRRKRRNITKKERNKRSFDTFEKDVDRCLVRQWYFEISSRKDPP